jgi:uncharacterized protein YecE (DUF72 family)
LTAQALRASKTRGTARRLVRRRGNYSQRELESWARRLHAWRKQSKLFVYFNNDWEAFAPRNASKLREQLDRLNRNDG